MTTPTSAPTFSFEDFLEKVPPYERVRIPALWLWREHSAVAAFPKIKLHCQECNGDRYFDPQGDECKFYSAKQMLDFKTYRCRNCAKSYKTFAFHLIRDENPSSGTAMKYGEFPPFGPTIPTNVMELLGTDAALFKKGVDSESRGLGIGAFGYYRRVLENQRTRIFDKTIEVAKKLGAESDVIAGLTKAKGDRQFTKSVDAIKPGPLKAIYIDGHNPLTLLYDIVSDGLHGQSDIENLEVAQTVRLLITDLARRIDEALADHAEVTSAVTSLLKVQAARRAKQNTDAAATGQAESTRPPADKKP